MRLHPKTGDSRYKEYPFNVTKLVSNHSYMGIFLQCFLLFLHRSEYGLLPYLPRTFFRVPIGHGTARSRERFLQRLFRMTSLHNHPWLRNSVKGVKPFLSKTAPMKLPSVKGIESNEHPGSIVRNDIRKSSFQWGHFLVSHASGTNFIITWVRTVRSLKGVQRPCPWWRNPIFLVR